MALAPFPDSLEPDKDESPSGGLAGGGGGKMSFLEHLDELRKRLVVSGCALLGGFLLCFVFIQPIFNFIMVPLYELLPEGGRLAYTEPAEAFFLYIKIAALAGLVLAVPVILSQVWQFVAPGLYSHEKRFAIPFVVGATIFFVGGAAFSHYILFRTAWVFFAGFGSDFLEFIPRIQPAFSLYVRLLLACGLVFQMPILVFFLSKVGVITASYLARNIKYAVLLIFIFAAVLTPTGDPVTLTMMAAPMIALYGLSIGIAWVVRRGDRPDKDNSNEPEDDSGLSS